METGQAYDLWATQYDTNQNRTRDLEAVALREVLHEIREADILEIGCGTGKNSAWLVERCKSLKGIDLSSEMLSIAKNKVTHSKATFYQADVSKVWAFSDRKFDLITFSLVLEHLENLDFIFKEVRKKIKPGGLVYVGELHPFKQYSGTKARFDTPEGRTTVNCFNHHVTDFTEAAERNGLSLHHIREWFDEPHRSGLPRILTLLFKAVS